MGARPSSSLASAILFLQLDRRGDGVHHTGGHPGRQPKNCLPCQSIQSTATFRLGRVELALAFQWSSPYNSSLLGRTEVSIDFRSICYLLMMMARISAPLICFSRPARSVNVWQRDDPDPLKKRTRTWSPRVGPRFRIYPSERQGRAVSKSSLHDVLLRARAGMMHSGTDNPNMAEPVPLDVREIFDFLLRRWKFIIGVTTITFAAFLIVSYVIRLHTWPMRKYFWTLRKITSPSRSPSTPGR